MNKQTIFDDQSNKLLRLRTKKILSPILSHCDRKELLYINVKAISKEAKELHLCLYESTNCKMNENC